MQHPQTVPPQPLAALDQASIHAFFVRYGREFNRGLGGAPDEAALAALYAEAFVAASPAGVVVGHNDAALRQMTTQGFSRYRDIGMTRMDLEGVTVSGIDAQHALAHTVWNAVYRVGGAEKSIRFTNAYLVRSGAGGALQVFGWITGDEEAAMRQHGIGGQPS